MQNVLVDDRRIWVDFSQSVAKSNNVWSNNPKRGMGGGGGRSGGFGGRDDLVKTSRYRDSEDTRDSGGGYGMVFDVPSDRDTGSRRKRSKSPQPKRERERDWNRRKRSRERRRSRSPDRDRDRRRRDY